MRTLITTIIIALSIFLVGCSYDSFDFKAGTFSRCSFLQDISISSIEYDPEAPKFKVEGVDSDAKFEALVKAAEALR